MTGESSGASVDVFWRSGDGYEMHLQLAGKSYKGYFCPDRDCEGKPVWVDD